MRQTFSSPSINIFWMIDQQLFSPSQDVDRNQLWPQHSRTLGFHSLLWGFLPGFRRPRVFLPLESWWRQISENAGAKFHRGRCARTKMVGNAHRFRKKPVSVQIYICTFTFYKIKSLAQITFSESRQCRNSPGTDRNTKVWRQEESLLRRRHEKTAQESIFRSWDYREDLELLWIFSPLGGNGGRVHPSQRQMRLSAGLFTLSSQGPGNFRAIHGLTLQKVRHPLRSYRQESPG